MEQQTTLQMVLDLQKGFQQKMGYNEKGTVEDISSLVHSHASFIMEETIEMLREMPYHKPWRDYSDWDLEKMQEQFGKVEEEWTDIFIFLMNIAVFLKFDEKKIKELYLEKLGLNRKRQEDPELGYVLEEVK